MPTMKRHEEKLRRAIQLAAEEHGVPNSFGFSELHRHYGAPPPMIAGKILRTMTMPHGMKHEMNAVCLDSTYCVTPPL